MKKKTEEESELIDFYGTECVHCKEMEPLIERLEKETGKKVKRLEVWHNEKNAQLLEKYGGIAVPFFYNTKTKKSLFGAVDYETLKKWALGE